MASMKLYHMPGACSRVAVIALEETGQPYEDQGVSLFSGEQYKPAYQALNPKGKVPVLVLDGTVVTELPVILFELDRRFPDAGLLPHTNGTATVQALSDVVWAAGGLHPLASRMFRPQMFSTADTAGVKAIASGLLADQAKLIAARLANQPWWYGQSWSIMDSFVDWVFWIAAKSGFSVAEHSVLVDHAQRVAARPAYARAVAREDSAMTRDNLAMAPRAA